jgi:hypothetical protein
MSAFDPYETSRPESVVLPFFDRTDSSDFGDIRQCYDSLLGRSLTSFFFDSFGFFQQLQTHPFNCGAKVAIGCPCHQPQAKFRFLPQTCRFILRKRAGRTELCATEFHEGLVLQSK